MIVTVVNRSDTRDARVQEVIRAVNRQIREDFSPYWHVGGELRLEGPIGRYPDPENPEELRGDAVLYLSPIADRDDALGYHDRNYRGIPFGFVFTDLAERLGEDWTVTFSHEALEIVADPGAHQLVRGPHPVERTRYVYHWLEVCDAVQGQSYEIDGVAVSNFVLPLYFTEGEEEGSRNDFLGDDGESPPLPSFGVAPGGYVGFFDPETQSDEQHFAPGRLARDRWAAKRQAGWTRRAERRRRPLSPEPMLRRILGLAPGEPFPGPWFEGLAIDVATRGRRDPYDVLDAAATAALGPGWTERWQAFEPAEPDEASAVVAYDLVPNGDAPLSHAEIWDLVHALRRQPGVADVEPDFVFFRPDSEALRDLPRGRRFTLFGFGDVGASQPYEWCLDALNVRAAWSHTRGTGVWIGHPDTGFLRHPEIWSGDGSGPIDTTRDFDFTSDPGDTNAEADPRVDGPLPGGPNHGTATASVIVSAPGPPPSGAPDAPFVSGVAPDATLVPLRVGHSVVHFSGSRLRRAVRYATAQGFDVLSISLGGPLPGRRLEAALAEARARGLVLIAAAGNVLPWVVWPARYPEVIAVAACNADDDPWWLSARGADVDLTAPGESVWRAFVDVEEADPAARFGVERSDGTSYAAAHVAGICALWISHHGRDALWSRYHEYLGDAFRFAVVTTARRSDRLDRAAFGAGIADAGAALALALPSRDRVARWVREGRGRGRRAAATVPENGALACIAAQLPGLDASEVRDGLQALLDTPREQLGGRLREVGDELVFRFAADPTLGRLFAARCSDARLVRGRTADARAWRSATFASLRSRLRTRASAELSRLI